METQDKLFILWTSGEKLTFDEMVFMYAYNSMKHQWWKEITLIIWGAATDLAGKDSQVQHKLKKMQDVGIEISACKACADDLKYTETLENIGVEVKYWGTPLTEILKSGARLITI
jgi:hypothetical protein